MRLLGRRKRGLELAFEAYGVGMVVALEDAQLEWFVEQRLPPGHRRLDPSEELPRLTLQGDSDQGFDVLANEEPVTASADLEVALRVLDEHIRAEIALRSREAVFVQAGTVGHRGHAIVLPGRSFSGKSTLVAALVRAGASLYSDEFAVLDDDGRVRPYAKPGAEHLPVGTIVVTRYRPGGSFEPERLSSGEGALALVGHSVATRDRPAEVMAIARRAAERAVVLEGDRGEADSAAREILARSEQVAART
jgi:hypothetical protein